MGKLNHLFGHKVFLIVAVFGAYVVPASTSFAAFVCSDEKYYPAVWHLEKGENGLEVFLGGKFARTGDPRVYVERASILVLQLHEGKDWARQPDLKCSGSECFKYERGCEVTLPELPISKERAAEINPHYQYQDVDEVAQSPSSCVEVGDDVWFVMGSTVCEGGGLVGGIGRFLPKTGKLEIRRPSVLMDSGASHLAYDGKSLWFGTERGCECLGAEPTHGLVRYDWEKDQVQTFAGTESGPCGFIVHDILADSGALWVATDLGLSRLDFQAETWRHYVPQPDKKPPMRETTCDATYKSLISFLPRGAADELIGDSFYAQFFSPLSRFRPNFVERYVRSMPPSRWGCEEMEFLASRMQNFKSLREELLKSPVPYGVHFDCIVRGFSGPGRGSDLDWRDFLLSKIGEPGGARAFSGALDSLKYFRGDAKVGDFLVQRLEKKPRLGDEALLLPVILGTAATPHLMNALDRQDLNEWDRNDVVEALERATHTFINPEGAEFTLPKDSDTLAYFEDPRLSMLSGREWSGESLSKIINHWKVWWGAHRAEYIHESAPSGRKKE
ncbi:MAG: hypothetical protein HYT87_01370 [Nitrospirae bacterium]|nr:hypothetical protein [Nitrospirota bacterium]